MSPLLLAADSPPGPGPAALPRGSPLPLGMKAAAGRNPAAAQTGDPFTHRSLLLKFKFIINCRRPYSAFLILIFISISRFAETVYNYCLFFFIILICNR
jgi:hypothetical protein